MSMNRKTVCIVMMLAVAVSAWVGAIPAQAQSSDLIIQPNPGDTTIDQPRVNVRGGALSARRPGNRIQAAISRHVHYSNTSLHDFGGADLGADPRRGFEQAFILADFITNIFDALNELLLRVLTGTLDNFDDTQESADEG